MPDIPKPIKRQMRELAGQAYEIELSKELDKLLEKFNAWKAGQMDAFELEEHIHRFHNGTARELYNRYQGGFLENNIAYAVTTGILDAQAIPDEVMPYLKNAFSFYESIRDRE
jgi:hypothetical protein